MQQKKKKTKKTPEDGCKPNSFKNLDNDGSFCYKVNKIMPYVGMVLIGICVIIYYYKNYNKLEFNTASHKKKNPPILK